MKTIIKIIAPALTVFLLSMQVNGQTLPTPGNGPSLNPTVPSNPQGLPPNSNFPPNNVNPPATPGTTGNISPPEVPNQINKTPGYPGTPTPGLKGPTGTTGITTPTGTPGLTGPRGSLEHSCNGSCSQVNDSRVMNIISEDQMTINKP